MAYQVKYWRRTIDRSIEARTFGMDLSWSNRVLVEKSDGRYFIHVQRRAEGWLESVINKENDRGSFNQQLDAVTVASKMFDIKPW